MTNTTMTTSNEHNNAPAVPQGEPVAWLDLSKLSASAMVYATGWKSNDKQSPLYTTPAPAPARGEPFGYFRAEPFGWTDCSEDAEGAIALYEHPAHEKHWTENEPVRLPSARTDRVYLAGPMTGIAELNFPAFNQEADRLRAEGLQVLNPADHGIVDGADWADYLRHDIAGLSSCERIHLLRGWTKSKGACLEMTIAKALGMTVTYQVDAEIEHNNAPAVPQWLPAFDDLDDDVIDAACLAGSVLYRVDLMRAYECIRAAMLAATPAPAPAQEVGLTDEVPAHVAGLLEHRRELDAIEFFESTNRDSHGFKKSVRGTYVNPAVARDWKWFQLGMKHATKDES